MAVAVTTVFEDLAQALADRLVREAIWHDDRCTWLGDEVDASRGGGAVVHRAVGGDLYNGTAGIGWFLAHLAGRTGDRAHAVTAAGALRHALRRSGDAPPGLYSGRAGIAVAAVSGGRALGDEAVTRAGIELADDLSVPHESDLIAGRAGTVVALLALGRRGAAAEVGDGLLDQAVRSERGWCWPSPPPATEPALCGLGHGASGIGLALLELAEGDDRFAEAAAQAFAYERTWLNRDEGNWPDLRELDWSRLHRGEGPPYLPFWCHGAPGVGLARLRAYSLTGDRLALAEAAAAIDTSTAGAFRSGGRDTNLSLCHGLGSLTELHLVAAEVTGDAEHVAAARRLAELALARLPAGMAEGVPCGVPNGGETPGLMLGLAGVAATMARLADPSALPSPVLVAGWGRAVRSAR